MAERTIDARRVSEILLASRRAENPVVSIYFGASGPKPKVALRDLVKTAEQTIKTEPGLDERARIEASDALAKAASSIEANGAKTPSGTTAVFAWNGHLQTVELPCRLKDRITIGWSPYIAPLESLVAENDRYALVLADHKTGKILSFHLGQLEELDALQDAHDKNIGRAGWFGRDQLKMNHHRDQVLHRHAQHVADRLFAHHKNAPFDRIVLAGDSAALSKIERALHPYLSSRIVAREGWDHRASYEQLRGELATIAERVESEKEQRLISRIRDHAAGDLHAALGPNATLEALWSGRVATLVVPAERKLAGLVCESCRFLAISGEPRCRECGGAMRLTDDLVEEAAELAILAGSKVRFVSRAKADLASLGNMAAILRYV